MNPMERAMFGEWEDQPSPKEYAITQSIIGLRGLLLSRVMPPIHYLLLLKGEQYECGSDYTRKVLITPLEELEHVSHNLSCKVCDGTGWIWIGDGRDDVGAELCDCNFK